VRGDGALGSNHKIYVMTATGAPPVRLTDNSSGDFQPIVVSER
jgi:hypothetical protein